MRIIFIEKIEKSNISILNINNFEEEFNAVIESSGLNDLRKWILKNYCQKNTKKIILTFRKF